MAPSDLCLERCLSEVGHWVSSNRLKLNADKTELLWAGSRLSRPLFGECSLSLEFGVDTVVTSSNDQVLGYIVIRSDHG